MELLPENREALSKRFPEVLRRIGDTAKESPAFNLYIDGVRWQLEACYGENSVTPHGHGEPGNLAERWLSNWLPRASSIFALSGFGLGHHARVLLEKAGPDCLVFVAERDPRLLAEVMSRVDCSDLLNDSRFMLGTGELGQTFFEPLRDVQFADVTQVVPIIYSPLYSLDEEYYGRFFSEIARSYEVCSQLYWSNIKDSALLQENTITNLPSLFNAPDIGVLTDHFNGLPLVLVGAGPSLDEAVKFLRAAREHAIIVCGNSSFRKLINNGIRPHLAMALDPRFETFKGYSGVDTRGVCMVAPFFVFPHVVEAFSGKTFTWTGKNTLVKAVRSRLGRPEGIELLERGTVSVSIADLAKVLGCPRVCLVGQDMALTAAGQTHTLDSFYADEGRAHARLEGCRRLPGNTLAEVPVESRLFVYLKSFEQFVEENPEIDFINTARFGARIAGVPYVSYEEALDWLGDSSSSEVMDTLRKYLPFPGDPSTAQAQVRSATKSTLKFARQVYTLSLEAAQHCEKLPGRLEKAKYCNHPDIKACDRYAELVNKLLDENPLDYQILFEGQTKIELYRYREKIRGPGSSVPHWERIRKNREYFMALAEGARFLVTALDGLTPAVAGQGV